MGNFSNSYGKFLWPGVTRDMEWGEVLAGFWLERREDKDQSRDDREAVCGKGDQQ